MRTDMYSSLFIRFKIMNLASIILIYIEEDPACLALSPALIT